MTLLLKSLLILCSGLIWQGSALDIDLNNLVTGCSLPHPRSISYIAPKFKIFSPKNPSTATGYITYNPIRSAYSNARDVANAIKNVWDADVKRIVFITHGFGGNVDNSWMKDIKDKILQYNRDQMVVIMGWKKGAQYSYFSVASDYPQAAANTQAVGSQLSDTLNYLKYLLPGTKLYAIGHSLGAHLMGYAGKFDHELLTRITGLDPAGVCFETTNTNVRLSKNNAKYVDVIHTDGFRSSSPYPFFGTLVPLGDIDIYPNWGQQEQPGCSGYGIGCSHSRAYDYFIWSIPNPGRFETHRQTGAPTYNSIIKVHWYNNAQPAEMGYYSDNTEYTRSGCYYLATNSAEPFKTLVRKYFILVHSQSGRVMRARSSYSIDLYQRISNDWSEQWYMDGQLIRSRKYPHRVLDFSATSYANNGYGHVYLNSYVHKQDDQRFIQKGGQIVLQWKSMGLVLDLKHNNAYATPPVIGCYHYHGGHAQTWTITYI